MLISRPSQAWHSSAGMTCMYLASTIASGEWASTSRRISLEGGRLARRRPRGTGMCRNGSPKSLATGSRSV